MASESPSELNGNGFRNLDNTLSTDLSSDNTLNTENKFLGNKRKLEVKSEEQETITGPPRKRARLGLYDNQNSNNYSIPIPSHPQYLLPVAPPQYYLPIIPHFSPQINPYMHQMHFIHPIRHSYLAHTHYNNCKQERNAKSANNNKKLRKDKSPFQTSYISSEEEMQLKNANNTLYAQFHQSRHAIYQRYQRKIEQIRRSNLMTQQQRKLQIKVAAIDGKVEEKKIFLSCLQMSKPLSINTLAVSIEKNNETKIKKKSTSKRVKKPKFSEYNVRVLRDWYETNAANPYPSSSEKDLMCELTGLSKYQVSRWFCNVRTRKPPPLLSDDEADIGNVPAPLCRYHHCNAYFNTYFTAHAYVPYINHFNFTQTNTQTNNDTSEGLMPMINNNTNLMPPPLIDENSNSVC